jgi:hypothetical protein
MIYRHVKEVMDDLFNPESLKCSGSHPEVTNIKRVGMNIHVQWYESAEDAMLPRGTEILSVYVIDPEGHVHLETTYEL